MPSDGKSAASTALPQPANVSQKVPKIRPQDVATCPCFRHWADHLPPKHPTESKVASSIPDLFKLQRLQCPLWVISGRSRCNKPCPLYPRKRTCACN